MRDWYERRWAMAEGVVATPHGEVDMLVSYATGEWPDNIQKQWRKLSFANFRPVSGTAPNPEDLLEIEEQICTELEKNENGILVAKKTFLTGVLATEFMIYSRPNFDTLSLFKSAAENYPDLELKTAFDIDRYWTAYETLLEKSG